MHKTEGGAVCKPYPVSDVIHPSVTDLCISRLCAELLHEGEVHVLDVSVIVRECSVDFCHLFHTLLPSERTFTRLVYEIVLVLETIDVSDHLAEPCAGNLVSELCLRNSLLSLGTA